MDLLERRREAVLAGDGHRVSAFVSFRGQGRICGHLGGHCRDMAGAQDDTRSASKGVGEGAVGGISGGGADESYIRGRDGVAWKINFGL